jgi:hypothetical protein
LIIEFDPKSEIIMANGERTLRPPHSYPVHDAYHYGICEVLFEIIQFRISYSLILCPSYQERKAGFASYMKGMAQVNKEREKLKEKERKDKEREKRGINGAADEEEKGGKKGKKKGKKGKKGKKKGKKGENGNEGNTNGKEVVEKEGDKVEDDGRRTVVEHTAPGPAALGLDDRNNRRTVVEHTAPGPAALGLGGDEKEGEGNQTNAGKQKKGHGGNARFSSSPDKISTDFPDSPKKDSLAPSGTQLAIKFKEDKLNDQWEELYIDYKHATRRRKKIYGNADRLPGAIKGCRAHIRECME